MQLRKKLSDDEACIHALFKLITFAIKNAMKRWLFKLSNNRRYHEKSQSSCKNDDENEASEAI